MILVLLLAQVTRSVAVSVLIIEVMIVEVENVTVLEAVEGVIVVVEVSLVVPKYKKQ